MPGRHDAGKNATVGSTINRREVVAGGARPGKALNFSSMAKAFCGMIRHLTRETGLILHNCLTGVWVKVRPGVVLEEPVR